MDSRKKGDGDYRKTQREEMIDMDSAGMTQNVLLKSTLIVLITN